MITAQKHVLSLPASLLTIASLLLCSCAPTNGPPFTRSQSASEHPSRHTTSAHTHTHTPPLSHVLAWLGEPLASLLSPSSNPIRATHVLPVPPCSSAHGISQARIPEQGAIFYSTEHPSSQGSLPCPHTLPVLFPLGRVRFPWALVSPPLVTV